MLIGCKNYFKSRNLEFVLKWCDGKQQIFIQEITVLYLPSALTAQH
jgi:hypothetical protein